MSLGSPDDAPTPTEPTGVPHTDRRRIALACVCLAIPVVALLWVPSYAREDPSIGGVPFFFWYQFLWVFLCSGLTWTAYLLTRSARRGGRR
ncbi:DUF3311 domain-containing protein [Nocardioides dongxiaopingii]|uniref:DUF3311 domain-containing protein n=1 Tax=Nocardioides dongxiaopingii TaxID=2576036 RepID=UPI0010C76A65|nr:DUF3311 domain-containing protein [Nocardioides dongxiaopingii]